MTNKILEDALIGTLPSEMQDAARDRLDELLEEGERLEANSEALLEEAEDAMAAWNKENPVVGTIEWHLKKADVEVRRAWGDAVSAVIDRWGANQGTLSHLSQHHLLLVIEDLAEELIPRLNSAAAVNAPAEPEVKPKVDADRVIRALEKDPELLEAVRQKLMLHGNGTEVRTWERLVLQPNTTSKLPLEFPDDYPAGPAKVIFEADEVWPAQMLLGMHFHLIGGEVEGEDSLRIRKDLTFPMVREIHLEKPPHRKLVVHVQPSNEGYLKNVRIEVVSHAR